MFIEVFSLSRILTPSAKIIQQDKEAIPIGWFYWAVGIDPYYWFLSYFRTKASSS